MAINVPIITTFNAQGINKAIRDFKRLEGTALKTAYALRTIDAGAMAVGRALAKVGLASAVVGGYAVKQFASFDDALTQSTAIMGDVSDQMRQQMADSAREMAKQTTFSATQAAESFYFLASAGLDAEASIMALPKVAQFAQAGMFDMARATDLLTDAQSALGLTIRGDAIANMNNMVRVSDVLVKANTLANASVEQFSSALTNKAGAAMKSVGMDIEEGVAVLAAFADQGIKAEEAGTQFSMVLRDLQTRAIENKKVFEAFGVTVFDSRGELRNMADIVGELEKALRGQSDEQKKTTLSMMGFADRSVQALLALLGTSDAIRRYEGALREAGGTTDDVANKQLQSLSSQLKIAWNRINDVAISLGQQLAPIVLKLVDFVEGLVDAIGEGGLGGALEYVAGKFASFYSNLSTLGKIIGGVIGSFVALRIAVASYNAIMQLGQIAVVTFGASLQTVSGIALGFSGVFTAIIASAGLIYSVYAKRKQEAEQVTKGFTEALKLEGQAQNEALIALANNNDQAREVIDSMKLLGFTFDDVRAYVQDGTGALADLTTEWDAHIRHIGGSQRVYAATYEHITGVTLAGDNLLEKYAGMTQEQKNLAMAFSNVLGPELVRLRDSELKLVASSELVAGLLGDVGDSAKRTGDLIGYGTSRFQEMARVYRERLPNPFGDILAGLTNPDPVRTFGGVVRSAQERLEDYISAIRQWERQVISVEDAQKALVDAQNAQIDATEAVADAQEYYNKVLNGFAQDSKEVISAQKQLASAQLRVRDAQLRTRDAQESLIEAQKRYQALFEPASARSVQEATDKVTEAQFRLADAQKELERIERRRFPRQRELAQAQIAVREATWQLADAQSELIDLQDGPSDEEVADAKRDIEDATRNLEDAQRSELEALEALSDAQSELNELINGATEDSERYRDAVEKLEDAKRREADAIDNVARALRNQRDALLELRDAEQEAGRARGEVRGDPLQADIAAFERTGIISPALKAELDKIDWAGLAQLAGSQARAMGGPVFAGRSYIVGERGPEMFVPRRNGTIIPNNAVAGGTTVVVNVAGSVTSESDLIETVRKGLLNSQRSGRTLILS